MPDLAPLLAAPDDDAPRLVYADAIGGARGELIVVQCALARGGLSREQALQYRRRERELLAEHGAAWADLPREVTDFSFRRGFVESVSAGESWLLAHADELVRRAPLLRHLTLPGVTVDRDVSADSPLELLERVLRHPALERLTSLDPGIPTTEWLHEGEMSNWTRGETQVDLVPALLARTGVLSRLRALRFAGLGLEGLTALVTHPDAAGLESLEVWGRFGAAGIQALLARPLAPRPRRLWVLDDLVTSVFENCMDELVEHPLLSRVTDLRVHRLEPGDLATLLSSSVAHRLRRLDAGILLHRASVAEVATAPALATLETLCLSGAMASSISLAERGGPVDLSPLCGATTLHALRELRLNSAYVTDELARAIVRSPLARQVLCLDLTNNPWMFGEEGAAWREALDTELRLDPPRPRPPPRPIEKTRPPTRRRR